MNDGTNDGTKEQYISRAYGLERQMQVYLAGLQGKRPSEPMRR